jgi:hypothetical protein
MRGRTLSALTGGEVRDELRKMLEGICRALADRIRAALPEGVGFALFLFNFGEGGNTAYVADADRADIVRLLYEWIEHAGVGPLEIAPIVRDAIEILKATAARGLTAGAITPARALALGVQMGVGSAGEMEPEASAVAAVELLEMMLLAEPVADAELEAERQARRS